MLYLRPVVTACLLAMSRAQSVPSHFVISAYPEETSDTTIGYLSSNGNTTYDPFDIKNVWYSISKNGTLLSYSKSDENRYKELGFIGAKPDVPNVLLTTLQEEEYAECAPITTGWSVVKDAAGYDSLAWNNSEFSSNAVYFCVTKNGEIGGDLYAVFTKRPGDDCVKVTLEIVS